MKTGKVLLGLLAGVAAGALMGILFAPEKGSKTRKRIIGKGEDYAEGMKEKFDQFLDTIKEKYEDTRQEAEEIFSKEKAKYEAPKKEHKNGNV